MKMKKHFNDCPIKRGYNICTCDCLGEEIAVIKWEIDKLEGRLRWYHFTAHLTLKMFGYGGIKKVKEGGGL